MCLPKVDDLTSPSSQQMLHIRMRALAVFAALLVALVGAACGDKKPIGFDTEGPEEDDARPKKEAPPPVNNDPIVEPVPLSYPATNKGLEQLMSDILDTLDPMVEKRAAPLIESLRLRKYEEWFESRFGRNKGKNLAAEYAVVWAEIGGIVKVLEDLKRRKRTTIIVEKFDKSGIAESVGYQSDALSRMIDPKNNPLYSVRLVDAKNKKAFHLWSFVHDGVSFRFVGKLKVASKPDYADDIDIQELRLADAKRIKEKLKKQ